MIKPLGVYSGNLHQRSILLPYDTLTIIKTKTSRPFAFHLRPLHWMCAFDISQSKYQGFGFSSEPFSSLWWLVKWNSDYVVNQGLGELSHDRLRKILTSRIRFAQKRCFQRPFVGSSVSWVYANLDWLVVSTPLKNISQLGWLFPKYGTIKAMFQTTNQWMFPTRQNEKAKWLASARTSQWDPMDRLRITRDLVAVISQQTYCWSKIKGHWISLDITRYHKLLIPNCQLTAQSLFYQVLEFLESLQPPLRKCQC